jgi:hypothetical protein
MVYAVLRKKADAPFRVPMQSVYAENPDRQTVQEWRAMR